MSFSSKGSGAGGGDRGDGREDREKEKEKEKETDSFHQEGSRQEEGDGENQENETNLPVIRLWVSRLTDCIMEDYAPTAGHPQPTSLANTPPPPLNAPTSPQRGRIDLDDYLKELHRGQVDTALGKFNLETYNRFSLHELATEVASILALLEGAVSEGKQGGDSAPSGVANFVSGLEELAGDFVETAVEGMTQRAEVFAVGKLVTGQMGRSEERQQPKSLKDCAGEIAQQARQPNASEKVNRRALIESLRTIVQHARNFALEVSDERIRVSSSAKLAHILVLLEELLKKQ